MVKLTLVISTLSSGGAERVVSRMTNYWAEKGWQITLLTFDDGREPPFYDLYPTVIHRTLGIPSFSVTSVQSLVNSLKQLWVLRRAIKKSDPQVLISFMDKVNVITLWATFGLGLPTIVSERTPRSSTQSANYGIPCDIGLIHGRLASLSRVKMS